MNLKKSLSYILSLALLINFIPKQKSKALEPVTICLLATTGMATVGWAWSIVKDGILIKLSHDEEVKLRKEIEKYKGFRPRLETTRLIKDVINGISPIKIYGQKNAKKQCISALSGCLENIYGKPSEVKGNVIYMIGDSGVGKTTMAKALANAFLKHHEKSCIFIDSSSINNEQSLGEQIFKTTTKAINLRKDRKWSNLFGVLNIRENSEGSYDIRVATPLLEHIFNYYEIVVIIDEYDKMKLICRPPDAPDEYEDKSADEVLKSIAANAEYYVENNKIDCRKAIFFVITNETKEQLYKSFGYNGSTGGGVQRLNVIEFDSLDMECCKKIIYDMIKDIRQKLTDQRGDFKLKNISFSEENLEKMASYIYNNKIKQARAKFDLEQAIYALFAFELEENVNKSFEIKYIPFDEDEGKIGDFSKEAIKVQTAESWTQASTGNLVDYSKCKGTLVDYSILDGTLVDYS